MHYYEYICYSIITNYKYVNAYKCQIEITLKYIYIDILVYNKYLSLHLISTL